MKPIRQMNPKFLHRSLLVTLFGFGIHAGSASAATIVFYDFQASANPTTEIADTTSTAVTSDGWFNNDQNGSSGRSGTSFTYFGRGPSMTAGTSWIGFTITADPTYTLDLTAMSFNYMMPPILSTGDPAFTFELRSSLSNFATAITGTYSANPVTKATDDTNQTASFDLSGGNYDDLEEISFRLYLTGNVPSNNNDVVRWDNILVEGSVAPIPETSGAVLLGFTASLALLRRRR